MKPASLRVIILLLTGAVSIVACAQTSPSLFGAPLPSPNGFDALIEAAKSYRDGREGWPTNQTSLSPAENLRGQRASVQRNYKTLERLRAALQLPVLRPLPTVSVLAPPLPIAPLPTQNGVPNPNFNPPLPPGDNEDHAAPPGDAEKPNFAPFDPEYGLRLLGNLLKQESGFRASSGDWNGALSSSLDCIQLGVVLTRGATLETAQTGYDIENLGRLRLESIVSRLDAAGVAAGAARLQLIETLRPPFSDAVRLEKRLALQKTTQAFEQTDWNDAVAWARNPDGQGFSASESAVLLASGQSEIQTNLSRVFDAAIAAADAPYNPQSRLPVEGADPWSISLAQTLLSPRPRVEYAIQNAATALLRSALEIESVRRKTGVLPTELQNSLDPFSGATGEAARLQFRTEGAAFRLYSVGPNGRDDGGIPLALVPDAPITPATPGDLVAPDFSVPNAL